MKKLLQLICFNCFALLLFGCAEQPQKKLLGKWQQTSDNDTRILHFQKGGSVILSDSVYTNEIETGSWVFMENNQIRLELPPPDGTVIAECEFSGSIMSLKAEGETLRFTRLK